MKKIIKSVSLIMALILLVSCAFISASAETLYELYGYTYAITDNSSISLYGWDNSSPELIIPDSVLDRYFTSVSARCMQNNTYITALDFSQAKHLQKIGFYSFEGCTGIENPLIIPESVTEIRESAFQNCSSVPSVEIKGDVSVIQQQCFYQCGSLKNAVLPENLVEIEPYAFAECISLEYMAVPKTVTKIAQTAFKDDNNLTLGVYYGTYAHQYAMDNNIAYVLLDGVKLGDADGDGAVTINDVTAIQQHVADMKYLEGIYLYAADVNRDGVTNISDATDLQRFLAEYEVEYPIDSVITQ